MKTERQNKGFGMMNTTTEEMPEMYLTLKERIDHIKNGQGQHLNRIQKALYPVYGIDFVAF